MFHNCEGQSHKTEFTVTVELITSVLCRMNLTLLSLSIKVFEFEFELFIYLFISRQVYF